MSNFFVIATRKAGSSESEITHYKYSNIKSSIGTIVTKEELWNKASIADRFYSYNIEKNTIIECEWYSIRDGQPFLKSDPNGTEKDNLLNLPNC